MTREKPTYKVAMEFCRAHLGKRCFAPFTGQDWSARMAFVYLVEMWGRGDHRGRQAAKVAMSALVTTGCQQSKAVLQVFVQTIPAINDWCHVREIWPCLWVDNDASVGSPMDEPFRHLVALYRDDNDVVMTRDAAEARWRSA